MKQENVARVAELYKEKSDLFEVLSQIEKGDIAVPYNTKYGGYSFEVKVLRFLKEELNEFLRVKIKSRLQDIDLEIEKL